MPDILWYLFVTAVSVICVLWSGKDINPKG